MLNYSLFPFLPPPKKKIKITAHEPILIHSPYTVEILFKPVGQSILFLQAKVLIKPSTVPLISLHSPGPGQPLLTKSLPGKSTDSAH